MCLRGGSDGAQWQIHSGGLIAASLPAVSDDWDSSRCALVVWFSCSSSHIVQLTVQIPGEMIVYDRNDRIKDMDMRTVVSVEVAGPEGLHGCE